MIILKVWNSVWAQQDLRVLTESVRIEACFHLYTESSYPKHEYIYNTFSFAALTVWDGNYWMDFHQIW